MIDTLDPKQSAIVFADLQPMLVKNSKTNPPGLIAAGAAALAQAARLLDMPALFSLVPEDGGPGTPLPTLAPFADATNCFTRSCASPFDDPAFAHALMATGRGTMVLAGYSSEAVIQFASLDAIHRGMTVVVALDAGGARSDRTEAAALRRIERAGAIVTSVADIIMTSAPDFEGDTGKRAFSIMHEFMGTDT